jgi:threonyl-tRNA synthetase
LPYTVDPGEGVFYGPKIDILLKDALGHGWQGPTIQVDFNLPERFDLSYIGQDGGEHRVAMIHRTVLGSMERFLGCLIEHYGGAFPVWLAPRQVVIIPIADRHLEYARSIEAELKIEGIRARLDERSERMNLKIRESQLGKVPYMVIVGDEEVKEATVTVRLRSGENIKSQSLASFKARVKSAIESKRQL